MPRCRVPPQSRGYDGRVSDRSRSARTCTRATPG
jgi:hypothetical protein